MNRLTIVTLGTGGEAFLTRGVERALHEAPRVVLRTARHPMADFLKEEGIAFETLDALYDECEDFDTFNRAAAVKVLSLLNESPVCYAVSDAAFDETVAQIQRLKPREADVRVLPGVSHADRCLALVADAPAGVRLYAAESFLQTRVSPEEPLLVTELHSRECAGSIKLRLMDLLPEDLPVSFFTGDETTGELAMHSVPLYELDRQSAYDHLTAAYVPAVPMERRTRYDMDDLVHVMERLRAPDGCPWDREQTHESLLPSLLEESYEYIQAVRDGDIDRPDDPNYANAYFVNANSNERPGVVDRRRVPITDPLEVYSGCYVRASITFYPFNTNGNRGIACGLQNIQKWCDGEPLNGRVRAEDEFDALDDVDDEDFLN